MDIKNILNNINLEELRISEWGYTELSLPINYNKFSEWVTKGHHLPLNYLADHRMDLRADLKNFYPEFESALVFLFSYNEARKILDNHYKSKHSNGLKIASYTIGFDGEDYHLVLKEALNNIGNTLKSNDSQLEFKLSLDIHPVLERDLAMRAGLGWQGKNSMFISRKSGSFFIIGSLLFNKKLSSEVKLLDTDHCGQCTRCIDACPTEAISVDTRTIVAKDCISTYTIEEFVDPKVPSEKMDLSSGFIFGCDICQDVCPWNKRLDRAQEEKKLVVSTKQAKIINFFLSPSPLEVTEAIKSMSNNSFKVFFDKTSFLRSGKRGI
jgi:epoxyqueuosine reductase